MKSYQEILTEKLGSKLFYYAEVDSTNQIANNLKKWKHGMVVVAKAQTAGRGTYGRSFYSAANRGIYMTLILDTTAWHFRETDLATLYTAVAVAEAVAEVTGIELAIKWVNDLFLNRRKVAGILTEADSQSNKLTIGIGINLSGTKSDFPAEIQNSATSLGLAEPIDKEAAAIVLMIYEKMMRATEFSDVTTMLNWYKKRLFILGEKVEIAVGNEVFVAKIIDVAMDGKLVINRGKEIMHLGIGEVRIML